MKNDLMKDLISRFDKLPHEFKKIFLADMRCAMDNRLKVFERNGNTK
jgi:hypothetical protein